MFMYNLAVPRAQDDTTTRKKIMEETFQRMGPTSESHCNDGEMEEINRNCVSTRLLQANSKKNSLTES